MKTAVLLSLLFLTLVSPLAHAASSLVPSPVVPPPMPPLAAYCELPMEKAADIPITVVKGRPLAVCATSFTRSPDGRGGRVSLPTNVYLVLLDRKGTILAFDTDPCCLNLLHYTAKAGGRLTLRVFNPNRDPARVFVRWR